MASDIGHPAYGWSRRIGDFRLEAAIKLGMTAGAVRVAKCRIIARLREIVAEMERLSGGKPANILLEKGVERAVLTDFGLARAADDVSKTRMGVIAGTPEYMSPEQARGEALDGRSDLFSLGCVLYEMATGVSPFRTDSTMATLRRIVDEQPAAMASLVPELPPWFSHIVERLLSKDPAQRFASASEVSQLLEQCLSHLQQPTSVPLPASLVPHATGRRSIFTLPRIGVIAMFGTIGMTLLGMVLWQATEAPDIAGNWTGEEWGAVVLEAKQPGQYQGSYNGTNPAESGTMQLKWSRVERRFNGTWNAGDDRKGKISLRLVGHEIRGALTTAKNAEKESDSPRLGDFEWKRSRPAQEGRVTIQALHGSDVIVLKGTKVNLEALEAALSQQFSKKATTTGEEEQNSPTSTRTTPADEDLAKHPPIEFRIGASKAGTLADAVAAFNAKAKLNQIGKDQPALTEDEVVAAIRGWIREKVHASDEVYDAFQKIAETRRLPERAVFHHTTSTLGREYDSDVWWVDLSIFTGEKTGYTLAPTVSPTKC